MYMKVSITEQFQTNEVPDVLYECVVEVDERVVLKQDSCQLHLYTPAMTGLTGEKVCSNLWEVLHM